VQEVISGFQAVENFEEVLPTMDALVFTVKHDEFVKLNHTKSILRVVEDMRTPVVIDGWGMFQDLIGRKDVFYTSVGIKC
jgi:UDP-N-acetyl-D-mannosaminuronate dehydrogenase